MAAITSAVLGGLGLATSGYQMIQGAKDKKAAQDLNNFRRQDLINPYANIQISTVGSDLMREEAGRTSANLVDASRGDIRSVMGNIPQIVALNNTENRNAQLYLDDQVGKRDYAIAGDQTAIRGLREQRDNMDLSGIGTRLNVGRQDMWNGIRGLASSASYIGNNVNFKSKPKNDTLGGNLDSTGIYNNIGTNNVVSGTPKPSASTNIPINSNSPQIASNFADYWNSNFYGF